MVKPIEFSTNQLTVLLYPEDVLRVYPSDDMCKAIVKFKDESTIVIAHGGEYAQKAIKAFNLWLEENKQND